MLVLDLVFTRVDSPYQFTDMIFRQADRIREALPDADYDFVYDGHLTADDTDDPSPNA